MPPFQGMVEWFGAALPRAAPWADLSGPFRARSKMRNIKTRRFGLIWRRCCRVCISWVNRFKPAGTCECGWLRANYLRVVVVTWPGDLWKSHTGTTRV